MMDPCALMDIPSTTRLRTRNDKKHIRINKEKPEKNKNCKQKKCNGFSMFKCVSRECIFCKCSATKENTSEVWEAMACSMQGQAPQTTVSCHCFVTRNRNLYLAPH